MKSKLYFWFANLIFAIHIGFGVFLLVGWRVKDIQAVYLLSIVVWIGSWVFLGYCPLSRWEFSLRKKYDPSIDPNREIIQFYLQKILGIQVASQTIVASGIVVCAILVMASLLFGA